VAPPRPNWATLGLDLVTLRIFAAAAEERSLARAAEREHIAQSAVSRRIAELEGRAGVQLLRRHDRGVEPTAAGEMLLARLSDLFGLLERIAADLDAHAGGARGNVVLHANISAISGPLPGALSTFLDAHPGLRVSLEERTSVEILHAVQTGLAELGIFSATVPVPDELTVLPWCEDRLVVLLPAGHALAAQPALRLANLLPEPFVGLQDPSALQRLYRDQAERLGATLRERVLVASFDGVRRLVEAGLGLSILPAAALAQPGAAMVTRPLAEPWALRPLALCLRQAAGLSAAARLLVQHLTGQALPVPQG
jgi:DNA-binding transcriptional LysR family regulator